MHDLHDAQYQKDYEAFLCFLSCIGLFKWVPVTHIVTGCFPLISENNFLMDFCTYINPLLFFSHFTSNPSDLAAFVLEIVFSFFISLLSLNLCIGLPYYCWLPGSIFPPAASFALSLKLELSRRFYIRLRESNCFLCCLKSWAHTSEFLPVCLITTVWGLHRAYQSFCSKLIDLWITGISLEIINKAQ